MNDAMLAEYTRLKIEEATRDLNKKLEDAKNGAYEYKSTFSHGNMYDRQEVYYQGKDELTKELRDVNKTLKETYKAKCRQAERLQMSESENLGLTHKVNRFEITSLINRLKYAFIGRL